MNAKRQKLHLRFEAPKLEVQTPTVEGNVRTTIQALAGLDDQALEQLGRSMDPGEPLHAVTTQWHHGTRTSVVESHSLVAALVTVNDERLNRFLLPLLIERLGQDTGVRQELITAYVQQGRLEEAAQALEATPEGSGSDGKALAANALSTWVTFTFSDRQPDAAQARFLTSALNAARERDREALARDALALAMERNRPDLAQALVTVTGPEVLTFEAVRHALQGQAVDALRWVLTALQNTPSGRTSNESVQQSLAVWAEDLAEAVIDDVRQTPQGTGWTSRRPMLISCLRVMVETPTVGAERKAAEPWVLAGAKTRALLGPTYDAMVRQTTPSPSDRELVALARVADEGWWQERLSAWEPRSLSKDALDSLLLGLMDDNRSDEKPAVCAYADERSGEQLGRRLGQWLLDPRLSASVLARHREVLEQTVECMAGAKTPFAIAVEHALLAERTPEAGRPGRGLRL